MRAGKNRGSFIFLFWHACLVIALWGVVMPLKVNAHQPKCSVYLKSNVATVDLSFALEATDLVKYTSLENWKSFARKTVAHTDFKYISDLVPRKFTSAEKQKVLQEAKQYRDSIYKKLLQEKGMTSAQASRLVQTAYARFLLNSFFEFPSELGFVNPALLGPRKTLVSKTEQFKDIEPELMQMFEGLEKTWIDLVRVTKPVAQSSLLKVSNPILIAGGRFREGYYWDTYFGSLGLILTGRSSLARMQLQNFVDLINTHGLIPNGLRNYYLTRSQPPVVSLLVEALMNHSQKEMTVLERKNFERWLVSEVYPALKSDYQNFWMSERLDKNTGLNFYSDRLNVPRPERHSHDKEKDLGETYRDVRAEAESGLDHTNLFQGQASHIATVSLNSFMYAYEKNLGRLALLAKDAPAYHAYEAAARSRQEKVTRYLWNPSLGVFQNYHLRDRKQMDGLSGDVFSALYTQLATSEQARVLVPSALSILERNGGIAASSLKNGKQWDGDMGWAPFQIMAIAGMAHYGFKAESVRVAEKWLLANLNAFKSHGKFYEKLDVDKMNAPIEDGSKYPTQTGFLWTNSSIVWVLDVLGFEFKNQQ